ncbi:tRNA pseudouridine synthase B [Piscibacillus halophilus]|uniref:tRNA pseudouridine synthase B n=2 Tax=Piscibacillus halophilus TaxID=571933 RepID=A0A1H8Z2S3_9BACI|nr:tRNA pseudouridine synthase B [Piscibacillus halophilus]
MSILLDCNNGLGGDTMDGVIPLNKPKGMTSHDCVNRIRRLLKTKKVGHTGTLDPDAEGVLPICVGKATKIASLLTGQTKEYVAEISLGTLTTTEDHSGEIVKKEAVSSTLEIETCEDILSKFLGTIEQTPPMYSAVKVNGKKLYEYAREGIVIERPSREIQIHSIKMLSNEITWYNDYDVRFRFKVSCSSGTYIRTLCVDIGQGLGFPAHMSDLKRTKVGNFDLKDTYTFQDLETALNNDDLPFINMADALTIPSLYVTDEEAKRYHHGQVLDQPDNQCYSSLFKVVDESNHLIAIYQAHPSKRGKVKPFKVF